MELYVSACRYEVRDLSDSIVPKLDVHGAIAQFCNAFKDAYEKLPGNLQLRELFRKKFIFVFDNASRSGWEWDVAGYVAELTTGGGDFSVDLTKALATAQQTVIRTQMESEDDSRPEVGANKRCGGIARCTCDHGNCVCWGGALSVLSP